MGKHPGQAHLEPAAGARRWVVDVDALVHQAVAALQLEQQAQLLGALLRPLRRHHLGQRAQRPGVPLRRVRAAHPLEVLPLQPVPVDAGKQATAGGAVHRAIVLGVPQQRHGHERGPVGVVKVGEAVTQAVHLVRINLRASRKLDGSVLLQPCSTVHMRLLVAGNLGQTTCNSTQRRQHRTSLYVSKQL